MTNEELTLLTQQIAQQDFDMTFNYLVRFNARLKTTGGRYHLSDHHIEINPLMLSEYDEATLQGVIKHELVHYYLHAHGQVPTHRNPNFKKLLSRVGGLRYAPPTSKRRTTAAGLIYECQACGQQYRRRRHINLKRYVCSRCHGSLELK